MDTDFEQEKTEITKGRRDERYYGLTPLRKLTAVRLKAELWYEFKLEFFWKLLLEAPRVHGDKLIQTTAPSKFFLARELGEPEVQ